MNRAWNNHSEWGNADSGRQTSHSSRLWLLALNLQVFMYVYKPCRYQGSSNPVLGLSWEGKRTPCYKDLNENNGTGEVQLECMEGKDKKALVFGELHSGHVSMPCDHPRPESNTFLPSLPTAKLLILQSEVTLHFLINILFFHSISTPHLFLFNLWARPAWQVAIVYEGITA